MFPPVPVFLQERGNAMYKVVQLSGEPSPEWAIECHGQSGPPALIAHRFKSAENAHFWITALEAAPSRQTADTT